MYKNHCLFIFSPCFTNKEIYFSLEILYLGGNRINEVPASVGRLINLTSLVLAGNQIETLPPTFADLQSLQSLTLHNNNLRVCDNCCIYFF